MRAVVPRPLTAIAVLLLAAGFATSAQATIYYSQGSSAPNLVANWNSVRAGGGSAPANFTTAGNQFLVQTNHAMTTTAAWSVTGAASQIEIENGGLLRETSTFTVSTAAGAPIAVDNGGIFEHNINQGTIPAAIWSPGATLIISGQVAATSGPGGMGQAFYNIIWNCPGASATSQMGLGVATGFSCAGTFTVINTGTGICRLVSTATNLFMGNLTISGGVLQGTGTSGISLTNTVAGNVSISGNGTLNLRAASGITVLNVSNNYSVTSGTNISSGSGTATINFLKNGVQTLTGGGVFSAFGGVISWVVGSSSTLQAGTALTLSASTVKNYFDVNGIFDLNGKTVALDGLTNDVANVGYITNSGAAVTLTLGNSGGSSGFSGAIRQGANVISLIKNGAGTQLLSGANTYTGNTTINGGTLAFAQPSLATNSTVIVTNNAVLQLTFTGTNIVTGFVTNGIAASAGVYNANNSSPFISGTGSLQIGNSLTNGSAAGEGGGITVNSVEGRILTVRFHQVLSSSGNSAINISNYTAYGKAIGPLTITNAVRLADNQTVVLYLNSVAGEFFAVGVSNVLDLNGSNIVASATGYLTSFTGTNIGTSGDPGTAGEAFKIGSGSYQITASGSDIGGTNDHCYFVSDAMTGDFETVANITRLDFTDSAAKICLMARDSTATGSRSVAIGFTPLVPGLGTNRVVMLVRTNTAGDTFDFGTPPQLNSLGWLRLTRTGNFFAAYYASNGVDWVQCGSVSNDFSATLLVGLAVTAHADGQTTTTAGATSFGIAGNRFGSDVAPALSFGFVSNNIIAKWQRTPRDYTVQVTDRLATGSPSVSSNLPPGSWAYVMLPVFDTSLTGTNSLMTTNGRYMTIPINIFSNNQMFVRLTQVEKVIPDPLGVTPGIVISQRSGNALGTNNGAYSLGGIYFVATNTVLYAQEVKTNVSPYTTNTTYILTPSSSTNYTFTTEDTDNSIHTVMQLRKYVNGVVQFTAATNTAGLGTSWHAQASVVGGATLGYGFIVASTNNPTGQPEVIVPTSTTPILLKINMTPVGP